MNTENLTNAKLQKIRGNNIFPVNNLISLELLNTLIINCRHLLKIINKVKTLFYKAKSEIIKGGIGARPIFYPLSPIFHINKIRLLFLKYLLKSENIGKNRVFIGKLSEQYRHTCRNNIGIASENIGQASEQNRDASGIISESHREIIGKVFIKFLHF